MRDQSPRPGASPTIYDVAQRAGVSISTVSLALNAPRRVRPDTLSRVQGAMRELGFVPKVQAAIQARKGTRRIGVVGRFSAIPSESERLRGLLAAAAEDGYEVVVFDEGSAAFHLHLIDSLSLSHKLDGLILVDMPISDQLAERLHRDHVPIVLVEYPRPGISCVVIDNKEGGRMVARYLADLGHRRCAFLGLVAEPEPSLPYPALDDLRLQGFREGLAQADIPLPDCYVRRAPISPSTRELEGEVFRAAAYRAAHALLDTDQPPTAVFANFDLLAAVVLSVARERGLRIPEDLAVVGFDDSDFATFLGLSTVRQHLSESGRVAFELLQARIGADESSVVRTVTLPLQLVPRSTS